MPTLVGACFRPRGALRLGSRWGYPGWPVVSPRHTISAQSLSEYSFILVAGGLITMLPHDHFFCFPPFILFPYNFRLHVLAPDEWHGSHETR